MPRRTKDEAQKTRADILKAAERCFYQYGVVRTSLESIAKEAGVTRGAVYWHFKDKGDLLRALADTAYLPHEELLDRLVSEDLENPLDALCASCHAGLDANLNDPGRRRLMTILVRRCEYIEEMQALIARNNDCRERARARFAVLFEKARLKKGLAEGWTPQTAALALQSMILGFIFGEMDYPKPSRGRDRARNEVIDAFFDSLRA